MGKAFSSSECLTNTKENVKAAQLLREERTRNAFSLWISRAAGEHGWIQIVPEVEADGSDGRPVTYPNSNSLGNVVIAALEAGALLLAKTDIGLPPIQEAVHHVVVGSENVARIVEYGKAHVIAQVGEINWWHTKFEVVEKQSAPPQGKTGRGVAGTCLI